ESGRGGAGRRPPGGRQRLPVGAAAPGHRLPRQRRPGRAGRPGLGRRPGSAGRGPQAGPGRAERAATAPPRGPGAPLLPGPVRGRARRRAGDQRGRGQVERRTGPGRAGPPDRGEVMTATEDRLTDALDAAARSVTAPGLRPLGDRLAVSHAPAGPRRPRWLGAGASAAAVAMIATVVVVVSTRLGTTPPAGAGTPPRYYVGMEGVANPRLVVRATATGQVTAVVSKPGAGRGQFAIVADGSGGGTFFAEWVPDGTIRTVSIRIYRFRVTTTGRIIGMAPVPG